MSQIEDLINISELSSYLAYANTPRYLYTKFLPEKGIFDISQNLDESDYTTFFDSFLAENELSLDDFAKLYAILFSSIHKDRESTISILNHKIIEKLKWGKQLREIILLNQKVNTSLSFSITLESKLITDEINTINITESNFKIENDENNN